MYKLLYPSIRVRTAPSVSVRVRVRVRVGVSFGVTPLRILICMCPKEFDNHIMNINVTNCSLPNQMITLNNKYKTVANG